MSNFNIDADKSLTYDAIVVGSGVSGGWAAKELCEAGLKTLVLERGHVVEHGDYPTAALDPWDLELRGRMTPAEQERHHKSARSGFVSKYVEHYYADDVANPYTEAKPFLWMRAHVMGGKSMIWGRQSYRWSDIDFAANAVDGHGVDWPIRYADLAPWYTHVERFAGVSGSPEGLPQLPDSHFLPPMELNVVERHVRDRLEANHPGRRLIIGRCAHLTEYRPDDHGPNRGQCQYRSRCNRGCPYGAYFSSNASTLPAANRTGNLTIRPYSIAQEVLYDEDSGRATGVRIIDSETGEAMDYRARVVFLCASALSSTQILLNSTSDRFPEGMGNDSGELGHNLMDHTYRVGAVGMVDGFLDRYYKGRRPTGIYIPRYWNVDEASRSDKFVRGFGYQGGAHRSGGYATTSDPVFGAEFKEALLRPGPWRFLITGFAECLPQHANRVYLNPDVTDKWGQPTLTIDAEWGPNEHALNAQIESDAVEMLEGAGLRDIVGFNNRHEMGYGIHEMGTARMGRDPKTSVLNGTNQVWGAPNVFVTDGACMTSSACVNPSLTYMALTARAVDHCVGELKRHNL